MTSKPKGPFIPRKQTAKEAAAGACARLKEEHPEAIWVVAANQRGANGFAIAETSSASMEDAVIAISHALALYTMRHLPIGDSDAAEIHDMIDRGDMGAALDRINALTAEAAQRKRNEDT